MSAIKRVEELSISSEDQSGILWRACDGYPFEHCGVVWIGGGIYEYPNVHCGDKRHNFAMDIDNNLPIWAIWHSHPTGPPWPSDEDEKVMGILEEAGYSWPHLIAVPGQGIYEYVVVSDAISSTQA